MKKVIFYAGLLVFATSCADQEFDSITGNSDKAEGISFEIQEADTRIQYDKDESSWNPFWYAENDRIYVWANGVNKGKTNAEKGSYGFWKELVGGKKAEYKATRSEKTAAFTSINDENLLTFVDDKNNKIDAKFLAIYPAPTTNNEYILSVVGTSSQKSDSLKIAGLFMGLNQQTIETSKGANKAIVMIAHATAKKENAYDAVGEKVQLAFNYTTPILKFGTKGLDETYQKAFGKLTGITVENEGYTSEDGKTDVKAPALHYGGTGASLRIDTLDADKNGKWETTIVDVPELGDSEEPNKITVTVGDGTNGLDWDDNSLAPVAVAVADRSAFDKSKEIGDKFKSMMEFEYIDLADERNVYKSFDVSSNFMAITFDLSKYEWLVTKPVEGKRTLFVNSGKLANIFTDENNGDVKWTDTQAENGVVDANTIGTVVIKDGVEITKADFVKLNKMNEIKHLTIENLATVPEEAFKDLSELTTLRLLKTTEIASANVVAGGAKLDSIVMPEYKFEDDAINSALLKAESLRYLDMGAKKMNAGFPAKGLKLEGFGKLYEVKVKDGVEVGANAFRNCGLLKKVNGRVNVTGSYAFAGCKKLTEVNISSQDIKAGTFSGCTLLETVTVNGGGLAPTSVGKEAFKGTIINVDLASATTIGESAFEENGALKGIKHAGESVEVLRVGAETISENAFKNCTSVKYIYFLNAKVVENGILEGVVPSEIKFGVQFDVAKKLNNTTFGNLSDDGINSAKLFVVPGQKGISDNKLVTGTGGDIVEISFAQIAEEEKY